MSKKLDAMLSEVEGLLSAAAAVSAKKKPQHAIEKDAKGKWRIRSMKDGKLWPQTYDSKAMANKGLAAYHLRKKGVPPKKTKASAECPECGSEAHIDMSGKSCPSCGWSDDAELHRRIQDGDEEGAADMLDEAMSASVDNMDMIRQLRDEAAAHGDMAQVELCDLALEGDEDAIAECMMAIESAKAMASAECPECGEEMHESECPSCGCNSSASTVKGSAPDRAQKSEFKSKNPQLFRDDEHVFYRVVDSTDIAPLLKGTKWPKHLISKYLISKYLEQGYKFYLLINRAFESQDPMSRVMIMQRPGSLQKPGSWHAMAGDNREVKDFPGSEKFMRMAKDDAMGEKPVGASAVKADVAYSPKNKAYLRKLQRLVDRGYLLPEEVGGAVFEALHMAKVSNRMAGAIASKVQEALMSAEPDVVDVSARARRK